MLHFSANILIIFHVAGALVLGMVVGYERHFRGRAAGTQVYGMVSMASCAVTILAGFPQFWYWGSYGSAAGAADPTRVIGSILTGVGFLGAGLIVQEGRNVRGLTTAASVWASSAIGILVGTAFYGAAIGLTGLLVACMVGMEKLERALPAHMALTVSVRFTADHKPQELAFHRFAEEHGFTIPIDSVSITYTGDQFALQFLIVTDFRRHATVLSQVSSDLPKLPYVESFTVSRTTI